MEATKVSVQIEGTSVKIGEHFVDFKHLMCGCRYSE